METIKLRRFRAPALPSPIVNVEVPERAGSGSPTSAPQAGGRCPYLVCTPGPAHPHAQVLRVLLAVGRWPTPDSGVSIETARQWLKMPFPSNKTKIHFVCAFTAQGAAGKGLAKRGDLSPLRGDSAWWGPTGAPPGRCKHEAKGAGQSLGPGPAWGGVWVLLAHPRGWQGSGLGVLSGQSMAHQGECQAPPPCSGFVPSRVKWVPRVPSLHKVAINGGPGCFPAGRIRRGAAPKCTGPPG